LSKTGVGVNIFYAFILSAISQFAMLIKRQLRLCPTPVMGLERGYFLAPASGREYDVAGFTLNMH
jgi:hypothetical protein